MMAISLVQHGYLANKQLVNSTQQCRFSKWTMDIPSFSQGKSPMNGGFFEATCNCGWFALKSLKV
jgi:hypothetical protein